MPGSQGAQLATELAANPAVLEVMGQGLLGAVAVCRLAQPPRSRLPITAVAMPHASSAVANRRLKATIAMGGCVMGA